MRDKSKMGAITISDIKNSKGQTYRRYTLILPKETMDRIGTQKGDKLIFLSENQGLLTFQFKRGA